MSLSLTILIIAISLIPLKIALFESTFALILCTPVLAFLIGKFSGSLSLTTYLITLAILYAVLYGTLFFSRNKRSINLKEEFIPIIIFIVIFNILFSLTQRWADFIAIGERLRDFAILSSVIQSPVDLKEPWMAGYPLNYYAFWYRFGHMLSSLLSLKTWQVYHLLQCFTYALYFCTAFRLLNKHLSVNKFYSVFFAILVCFGSNLAGVKDFVFGEPGWWGPSRVIPGAINEFPAWSFLLGDLHPHYLNLPLLPFFTVIFAYLISSVKNPIYYALIFFAAFIVCPLWIGNSNVWDEPVWIMFAGIFLLYYAIEFIKSEYINKQNGNKESKIKFEFQIPVYLILIAAMAFSLYLSAKNIVTPDYPKDWVKDPIARTTLHDFCLHFGIPIFIITVASISSLKDKLLQAASVLLVFYFFFFTDALPLLMILFVINVIRINSSFSIFSRKKSGLDTKGLLLEGTGLFSLVLLMVPEIIFLNDPYGADIERMNTIFKIYSVAWFFVHVYAFYLLSKFFEHIYAFCKNRKSNPGFFASYAPISLILFFTCVFSIGFFMVTLEERDMKNRTYDGPDGKKLYYPVVEPYEQGLSEIDRLFPGSAGVIKHLLTLPKGILLEAQGKPYDYTSMISTLSENPSFVGWVNHVNLLLNNIPEISRREKLCDEFYNNKDCSKKNEILRKEGIMYIVFGPLEKARYQGLSASDFSCLKLVITDKEYSIFTPA